MEITKVAKALGLLTWKGWGWKGGATYGERNIWSQGICVVLGATGTAVDDNEKDWGMANGWPVSLRKREPWSTCGEPGSHRARAASSFLCLSFFRLLLGPPGLREHCFSQDPSLSLLFPLVPSSITVTVLELLIPLKSPCQAQSSSPPSPPPV